MSKEPTVGYPLRLPKKLKKRLEKEARENKRSLNQEIVHRLDVPVATPMPA